MKYQLNCIELLIYFTIWISMNIYSLYSLFTNQTVLFDTNPYLLHSLRELEPGWRFTSRLKDISDAEWSSWKYIIRQLWLYLIIQFTVSEIFRNFAKHFLKMWYLISSMVFLIIFMGVRQFFIILPQPLIYASVVLSGGRKISVWILSGLILFTFNTLKYKYYLWQFLDHDDLINEEVYLVTYAVAWTELRCISFCIDFIDKRKKSNENNYSVSEEIFNILNYVFYLPLLYTGPVILYEDYEKCFRVPNQNLWKRLKSFTKDLFIFSIYTLLLDFAFHYIYFYAMQHNIECIRKLPTLIFCAGGLWMGLEFHMKYVISYGTTSAYAKLDNFEPPPTPRCIARVHIYSQMWRYFDVGLYRFLIRYVHKPSLDVISTSTILPKTVHKLLASLSTFIFIFLWHGVLWHIFIWTILNYFGILLENICRVVSNTKQYKWFKENVLITEAMELRFIALVCSPLLIMSAVSNFYLFGGIDIGNLYLETFLKLSPWNAFVVVGGCYCCCHVSMALEGVEPRTSVKKNVEKVHTN